MHERTGRSISFHVEAQDHTIGSRNAVARLNDAHALFELEVSNLAWDESGKRCDGKTSATPAIETWSRMVQLTCGSALSEAQWERIVIAGCNKYELLADHRHWKIA